ncbi:MAG: thiamine pyrophosphate-binding protein [Acetobacteraceae bacterium]|jgi:thiamine pyrophosphate-dependent acetolactate synthase large subunit-like protein
MSDTEAGSKSGLIPQDLERPAGEQSGPARYGSDVAAETLRALDIPFIALNPGSSYRGLHDSIVNHLGNKRPQMLVCLHEESAVALAHGWAKVTGRPMAAAVHSNVGLFHATMAVFNAWCDRVPLLLLGATGPVDAPRRRPWIDWIHTAADQGAILRNYIKWDAQPASPAATQEALARAAWLANTAPKAPVYVNFDAGMQEAALTEPAPPLAVERFRPRPDGGVSAAAIDQAVALLREARAPLILMGRVSRSTTAWAERLALAESLHALVATDLKAGAAFPTEHALHVGQPTTFPGPDLTAALAEADVILSLDWVDLGGTLRGCPGGMPEGKVIQVSLDHHLHNGWSMDHQTLSPVDLLLEGTPDAVVSDLVRALGMIVPPFQESVTPVTRLPAGTGLISIGRLAHDLRVAVGEGPVSLLHLPLGWNAADWPFGHPLDHLGGAGGAGLGAGPGIAVGAALALRETGRLPVAVLGDGDYLMGITALWTAAHYRIPLLVVVANNRSLYNDEMHQERVARARNRPVENKWIGQRLSDPDIDLAAMGQAQGALGFGPVTDAAMLPGVLADAVAAVRAGAVAVVDARVLPGYAPAMAGAFTGG